MGTLTYQGKTPEEVDLINTKRSMEDDKYLLMMQCLKDARSLYNILGHFDGSNVYLSSWEKYEENCVKLAIALFTERCKSPISISLINQTHNGKFFSWL